MSLNRYPSIVGVVDLLGYSDDIMSVELDPSHLKGRKLKLHTLRSLIEQIARDRCGLDATIWWGSDTCVVYRHFHAEKNTDETMIAAEESIRQVATVLGILQCVCAIEKYFSRGGIALGYMVCEAGEEPFGTGLARASEIEKSIVEDPKVGVSGRLAGSALGLIEPYSGRKMFLIDFPLPTLDYLSFSERSSDFGDPKLQLGWHAESVHEFVEYAYKVPSLAKKAAWLLDYHNWHIKSRGGYDDLVVNLSHPSLPEEEP